MSQGLTREKAIESPKIFQLRKQLSKGKLIAVICGILKAFCDSIKAARTMDAVDILEAAEAIEERYSHDSVKDIILALKEAKQNGTVFYNSVDISIILKILDEYFESKAKWLENRHNTLKSSGGAVNNEVTSLMIGMERAADQRTKELEKEKRDLIRQKAQDREAARMNYLASQLE